MAMPLRQSLRLGTYLLKQRVLRREKFPLLVELEPLFACNLKCAGCGKIAQPAHLLKQRMPVAQAVSAIEESGPAGGAGSRCCAKAAPAPKTGPAAKIVRASAPVSRPLHFDISKFAPRTPLAAGRGMSARDTIAAGKTATRRARRRARLDHILGNGAFLTESSGEILVWHSIKIWCVISIREPSYGWSGKVSRMGSCALGG